MGGAVGEQMPLGGSMWSAAAWSSCWSIFAAEFPARIESTLKVVPTIAAAAAAALPLMSTAVRGPDFAPACRCRSESLADVAAVGGRVEDASGCAAYELAGVRVCNIAVFDSSAAMAITIRSAPR